MDLVFDVEPVSPDTNATAVPGTTNRKQIDDLGMKSPVRAYVTISQVSLILLSPSPREIQ
jgi:hypothetical protein